MDELAETPEDGAATLNAPGADHPQTASGRARLAQPGSTDPRMRSLFS
jgi:hypothetical protein